MPETPFSYESSTDLTADEYLARERSYEAPRGWRSYLWLLSLTAVGIAALFRWPTFGFGVVLLAGVLAGWMYPVWSRRAGRRTYNDATYAHGRVTVRVTNERLYYRGGVLSSESEWQGARVWGQRGEYLWIAVSGMPTLYFKISELKERDLYDRILALARQHAMEFDSPRARAGTRAPAP